MYNYKDINDFIRFCNNNNLKYQLIYGEQNKILLFNFVINNGKMLAELEGFEHHLNIEHTIIGDLK